MEYAAIPEGSIAYKKGLFWKYIPPQDFRDGVKPQTLPRGVAPRGADTSGGNSPYTTIQRIGTSDARVPERISVDEGVVDAFITSSGDKIGYSGGGLETNVGDRDPSPTKGMSVKGHAYARETYPEQSVSRTAISAEETSVERKGVSRTEMTKDSPRAMLEIEADLGDYGEFGDEDDTWLTSRATSKKSKKKSKKRPSKSDVPTEVRRTRP